MYNDNPQLWLSLSFKGRVGVGMGYRRCALLFWCVAWLVFAASASAAAPPKEPILRIETGMHTAMVKAVSVDAAGRFLVTASEDKTVRVWDLSARKEPVPVRTLRPPIGPGNEGKLFAVAISPDGSTVACGGWTGWDWEKNASIYLFDRDSGALLKRLNGFPEVIKALRFSPDGKRLAAALGGGQGVYLLDLSRGKLAGADASYGNDCYGLDFDRQGRLATAAWDGLVRLYDTDLKLVAKVKAPNGERPYSVAFSGDGTRIAVGCDDARKVAVLSGADLTPLYIAPGGADNGSLFSVAWSPDGGTLHAAGNYGNGRSYLLRSWQEGGKGGFSDLPLAEGDIMQIAALPDGSLAYAAAGPQVGVVAPGSAELYTRGPSVVEHRDRELQVSADGAAIRFGNGTHFSVAGRAYLQKPGKEATRAPVTALPGVRVTGWKNGTLPLLNGAPLRLDGHETARSLAMNGERGLFVLGTDWNLRCFDRFGRQLWKSAAPGIAWQVNIAANGQVAVAAFGDGTIRWYRVRDGKELLAFFPHADRKRWVLWTPSGYYDASVGGEELAGWHVNGGSAARAADFFPLSRFRSVFCRPEVIGQLLQSLDEVQAVRFAAKVSGKGALAPLASLLPPVVSIDSPKENTVLDGSETRVEFTVRSPSGEPVTGIKVMVGGRPVAFSQERRGEAYGVTLPLPPGESEIAVIAENRHAASEPATVRVTRGAEPEPEVISMQPRLFILAVGVGAYPDRDMALEFAAKDAKDFASLMLLQKGGLYGDVSVKVLTDAAAGRQAVLDGLAWLKEEAGPRDTAIVFLSGHGVTDAGGAYYFLPVDGEAEKLPASAVVFSDIRNTLMSLPGKAVLFVDTCHAGDVMGGRGASGDVNAVANELSSAENGVVVFASSTGRQYSIEDPAWGNGAFTKALVEGVAGKADYTGKGRITVVSLDLWLSERVQELTEGKQTPTTAKPRTVPDFPLAVTPFPAP